MKFIKDNNDNYINIKKIVYFYTECKSVWYVLEPDIHDVLIICDSLSTAKKYLNDLVTELNRMDIN